MEARRWMMEVIIEPLAIDTHINQYLMVIFNNFQLSASGFPTLLTI
ncbi:hypothetical protein QWZ06_04425 [Chryseobacterium tructae]|uniref:Uncharacterized protein n=1 Tax=Chryseobacterium tructae TaxID=1037380 RepID=A0ABV7XTN2_9FLAO|nr:hypothetical protein [Chryseobacterium tructae]MDN3691552.1 hypothetical protein [Chryseobacterium tructae]